MDDKTKEMIDRYKKDLMRFHGAHGGVTPPAPPAQTAPRPPERPRPAPPAQTPLRPAPEIPSRPEPGPEIPSVPEPAPEITLTSPDRRQDDQGYLQVRTYTAQEATPVPDALVLVLQEGQLVRQTLTDEDGLTELIPLDTVGRDLSLTEGTAAPFTTYTVQITAEGYLPVVSGDVPVFGGVTAIQNVGLIPLPEFDTGGPDEVIDNAEPDL